MIRFWKKAQDTRPDVGAPGPKGLLLLAAILGFLYVSLFWLRNDPKLVGAVQLSTAFQYVLTRGAMESSPEEVFHAAAVGLTSELDPFSMYMLPEEVTYFEEGTQGTYVGIGVEIKITSGAIVIVRVLPNTAASEAGLRPGDRIVAIGDTPTAGFTLKRALELMRGPDGSPVSLIIRDHGGEERSLMLERRAVLVSPFPIHGISQSGTAYVRWTEFTGGSADRLAAIVEELSIHQPDGLIIDLRGNPGGVLDEAVDAAGVFLPPNSLVCRIADRSHETSVEYRTATPPAAFHGPVVIVLDNNSASASEVFAAALQEAGRAVIVGRRSFGKGWVQTLFPFSDGGALRLSTARYYTQSGRTFGDPKGRHKTDSMPGDSAWFAPAGLEPDVLVEAPRIGSWEDLLVRQGLLADFVMAQTETWPADHPLESLRDWCDSLGIMPEGLGSEAAGLVSTRRATESDWVTRTDRERLVLTLDSLHAQDAELLFEREQEALRSALWEQRMLSVERPDIAELEEYFIADPDLASARDLLEDVEQYDAHVSRWRDSSVTANAGRR